ncbi:hypothetical protein [Olleya sp. Bg11-27]|uniref:hypothetical protein n=1 Tax=Olleya sp. Bg11-27 TaxID=2058135 RepID=UPI000C301E49|nr:hypothetical protein [Olleya sp. Bg11-27]AUC76452.1 hypothetical protein CW732_12545 [Olleya sp. Bg11-27]
MSNSIKQFSEILSGPLGELIASIGRGVGEAQAALDEGSLRQTLELYKIESQQDIEGQEGATSDEEAVIINEERRLMQLIRSIGYQPTFYVIPETEVEAKVSLNMDITNNQSTNLQQPYQRSKYRANVTPLNANNINQYNLNANAAATLKFKIVPVPAPSGVAEKRIMPNLIDREYNEVTRELIESIGLNYKLDEVSGNLLEANPSSILSIEKQNIDANKIIELDTEILLTLKILELEL